MKCTISYVMSSYSLLSLHCLSLPCPLSSSLLLLLPLQLLETLLPLSDLQARVSTTVDLITSSHKNVDADSLRFAAATFYQKLKAADGYVPADKYHGNVTLLRAKASSDYGDNLGADYKLSEVRTRAHVHVRIHTHT